MPGHSGQGWLPAFLPVSARRIKVHDEQLARTLTLAGAELVEERPDLEIATDARGLGASANVIVVLAEAAPERGPRPVRAGLRALAVARVRVRALACRRMLSRRGFDDPTVVLWDVDRPLGGVRSLDPKQRFPLRALVIAGLRAAGGTVLDAAVEAAGLDARTVKPMVRQGGVVALAPDGVLRVSLGPGEGQLAAARDALSALAAGRPSETVAERVPWLIRSGTVGLASWSLERRLPGDSPAQPLTRLLLEDCCDFLVDLHNAGGRRSGTGSPSLDAAEIAATCRLQQAGTLERLGERVTHAVDGLPRGFGHGDFWRENLLVTGGRLSGVVDWASADPERLPLLDLLHLITEDARARGRGHLGPAVAGWLLPWAAGGGDELARGYCRRVGFEPDPATLEALGLAYWLDFVAGQMRLYADRAERPHWVRNNVELVLGSVSAAWH